MGSKVRGAGSEEVHEGFGMHYHIQNLEVVLYSITIFRIDYIVIHNKKEIIICIQNQSLNKAWNAQSKCCNTEGDYPFTKYVNYEL